MRILLVHNRYRSAAPSGENRVVDQESEALAALGHEVMRFGRSSDEIAQWPVAKKATLPVRTIWSRETYRDLKARAAASTARTSSTSTTRFPCSARLCSMPAVMRGFRLWPQSTTTG